MNKAIIVISFLLVMSPVHAMESQSVSITHRLINFLKNLVPYRDEKCQHDFYRARDLLNTIDFFNQIKEIQLYQKISASLCRLTYLKLQKREYDTAKKLIQNTNTSCNKVALGSLFLKMKIDEFLRKNNDLHKKPAHYLNNISKDLHAIFIHSMNIMHKRRIAIPENQGDTN